MPQPTDGLHTPDYLLRQGSDPGDTFMDRLGVALREMASPRRFFDVTPHVPVRFQTPNEEDATIRYWLERYAVRTRFPCF